MKWINATDLDGWADRLDSRSHMPELIRRLIHATVDEPRQVDFPSEESIQLGGWDGTVEIDETHPHVPNGHSGWELGTNQDIKGKADDEYVKRKKNPGPLDPAKTTFVFVTPRRWGKKKEWEQGRRSEGFWVEVRVFDADNIEQWTELAPAVGAWLAALIGKYPTGAESVIDSWAEFSASTNPPIPKDLLLAGRLDATERVRTWLAGPPTPLNVEADSPAEAVAFFAAALLSLPTADGDRWTSRAILSADIGVLRQLGFERNPLVIVWGSEDQSMVGAALSRGHHVFIPSAHGRPSAMTSSEVDADLRLPRIPTDQFVSAMVLAGLPEKRAEVLARETARSIPVLQRRIAASGRPAVPSWARPENAQDLVPVLLASSWTESNATDCAALEQLGETPYSDIQRTVSRWASESDTPIQRIGAEWSLVSPLDAWHLLSRFLTSHDLERVSRVAVQVLSIEDPALELPSRDRWASAIYQKQFPHSPSLRAGLAQTLTLLATIAQRVGTSAKDVPQTYVDRVVWALLGSQPGLKRWYSLSGLLPTLAEAAPESFLRALEDELGKPSPEIVELFSEEGWMGHSSHTGLLWALENLAWFPSYLGRVTVALGKLARLDPGGKLANRPQRSLRDIFLGWRPQTAASLDQRMQALNLLITKFPEVAWKLVIDLLPNNHDSATPNYEPRWREKPETAQITNGDYFNNVSRIVGTAVEIAGVDPSKLSDLVSKMGALSPNGRAQLTTKLSEFAKNPHDSPEAFALWENLREFVNRHRKFTDTAWALSEDELLKLDPIVTQLRPPDRRRSFEWLFNDWWPHLPDADRDPETVQARVDAARLEAIGSIYAEGGVTDICALARLVKYPAFVGEAAASLRSALELRDDLLDATLGASETPVRITGVAFAAKLIRSAGSHWATDLLTNRSSKWSAEAKADFLVAFPAGSSTWDRAHECGVETEHAYWSHVGQFSVSNGSQDELVRGVTALIEHGRSLDVLQIVAHRANDLASALLVRVLDEVGKQLNSVANPNNIDQSLGYDLEQVLGILQARGDTAKSELVRLEWFYLPLLRDGYATHASTLHSLIGEDPEMFTQLIRWVYRPRLADQPAAEEPIPTEEEKRRAHQAYDLLSSWRALPGLSSDGALDTSALNAWINRARELCHESGHTRAGDEQIGQVLAWCPSDPDGLWPVQGVRDLIERVESRDLETGLHMGITNKRGVTTRNLNQGGKQERSLAQCYGEWADRTASGWPRTSAFLRSLSREYEQQGRREDDNSRHWDRGS